MPRWSHADRTMTLLCLVVLATTVLAGCTQRQSPEQYEARLKEALAVRTDVTGSLDQRAYDSPGEYQDAAARIRTAIEELDADEPPKNLVQAHEQMVEGMYGIAKLLDLLASCEIGAQGSERGRAACQKSIPQSTYDEIRDDFDEANTIYRAEGLSLAGLGSEDGAEIGLGEDPEGGDEL